MKQGAGMTGRTARLVAFAGMAMIAGAIGAGQADAEVRFPNEMIVYDWNRPVTRAERGFPRDFPPKENGNWVSPTNYAEGTYHLRVQIRKQPVAQKMRLQFCVWQDGTKPMREMCSPLADLQGKPGTVVTWSVPVAKTQLRNKKPIIWTKPRRTNGVAIKDERGYPISDYGNPSWNWFGENPSAWYPLDMRFTVVVVAKGATFGGWDRYLNPVTNRLEAEDAQISRGKVMTDHTGFSGTGFVDYVNELGGYVEWRLNAATAQNTRLTFRYSNGTAASRPLEIIVNGETVDAGLGFSPTGDWDTWQTQSVTVALKAGANTIRARAISSSGGPNLDRLDYAAAP
jgi:hypothetical protein